MPRLVVFLVASSSVAIAIAACSSFGDSPAEPFDGSSTEDTSTVDGATPDAPPDGSKISAYRDTILGDQPIAYWRMALSSQTLVKDEVGGNDLALQGGGSTETDGVTGDGDKAIHFDGRGWAIPNDSKAFEFAGGKPFTIECWAKAEEQDGGDDYHHIVADMWGPAGDRSGYSLYLVKLNDPGGTTRAAFEYNVDAGEGGIGERSVAATIAGPGVWVHYVIAYANLTQTLYVDGTLVAPQPTAGAIVARSSLFSVGADFDNSFHFVGAIDEVAVYDRVLTTAEVQAHSNAGKR